MKNAFALTALAAALAAPGAMAAEVSYSGVVRAIIDMPGYAISATQDEDMLIDINRARFRVDAKQALDNGMTANAYIRFNNGGGAGVSVNQTGLYFDSSFGSFGIQGVGDSGNFGDTMGHLDIFENGALVDTGFDQGNDSPNTLWYDTKDFNGLKFKIAVLSDPNRNDTSDNNNMDLINPRVTYTSGPIFAALGYVDSASSNTFGGEDYSRINLGVKYSADNMMAGISYESVDNGAATNNKSDTIGVSFSMDMGTTAVRVGHTSLGGDNNRKGSVTAAGFDYKLGKGVKLFAEAASYSDEVSKGSDGKGHTDLQFGAVLGF